MAVTPLNSNCEDIQGSCEFVELNTALQNVCLAGVYVTNNVKCFERCMGRVVKSNTNIQFSLRYISERNEIVHFTNEESADNFLHVLSNFGYSAALQNHNCDVENKQPNDLHRFYRRSAFRVVNIGKWAPNLSDLSLSRPAIRFLKDIESKLQSSNNEDKRIAQEDCIAFFKIFGTHVYITSIHVGGIFSVSAQTALLENDNVLLKREQVIQVHNNAIISHTFEDVKADSMETKEHGRDEYVLTGAKIEITQKHFGGSQQTRDFTKWKAGLLKNPETWTVSDTREISFKNCIGIWDFVKKHQKSFSHAEQLSGFLAKTWYNHIAHGDMSNFLSVSLWKTFVKGLESTLSEPCSANCHLRSLRELLHLLEKQVSLVGKEVVTNVVDISSETSVQKLFTESAEHKTPISICFQILTTKLKILQIDNGKSLAIGASWITSNYFIPGLISQREFKTVEELFGFLESEFLPGIDALEACGDIDLKNVQSFAKSELLNTIQHFLQNLLDRQEYREALLLLVLFLSIGYHFKEENILVNITFEVLVTFIESAKGEMSLARKYSENETQEAWLLLEIIFKLDTNYRVFDASIVLENQFNDFVCFLKDKRFVFHSNITNVIYSEKREPHGVIHSLAEICRFPCEIFGDESMRTLQYKSPECCLDSANSDALHRMIKTFGMEKFFPQKLSTEDVLKLSDTLFTSPKTLEDIPWAIFRHAIAIDYNFRENILSDFFKKIRHNQTKSKKEDNEPTESEKEDREPTESKKEDKEPNKSKKEDYEPTESKKGHKEPTGSKKDDKQLVKSKSEDRELVKIKTEERRLVKSKIEDRQLLKNKTENRQLVKSKIEDRRLVKSKIEDRMLGKSNIEDRRLVKSKIDDRQLIKSKNEDRMLVKSKNEERQLIKSKTMEKQSAKRKADDKRPAKSKQEDKKLVKSKMGVMQPTESKKEETQFFQNKKEERQPAECKGKDNQPAESKKEYYQPADKRISTKHNPMDVFLALWHCCDPFLKKILAAKIVTCKFALPLIYRNVTTKQQLTISLWPIRDIFIDDSPDSVLNKPLKTVSFVRIGDLKVLSKSKIINKFLRGQNNEHNTFYHRDCTLGTNKRLVSNGLVEISWYVPRTDNGDVTSTETAEVLETLTQPLCILNMRGDAKCFSTQLLALLALSDVVVVMSEFENLNDEQSRQVLKQIHKSSAFAIVMTDFPKIQQEEEGGQQDEEELFEEDLHHFYERKTGLNPTNVSFLSTLLNESDLKDNLTVQITSALKSIIFPQSLERKRTLLPAYVAIDEDNTKSKYGSDLSETVFADVEYSANTLNRKQIKDKILPLQGENLWHTWCLKQKECFRSVKKSVVDNVHHENLMKTIRLWQVMCCFGNQSTIVKFIDILERHIDDRDLITYFLQWMKLHMDCQSRQIIPKLSSDLYEAFRRYETLRSQGSTDGEKVDKLKSQIKIAEENLARASFGLEHIFREMGQLYESFLYCDTAMQICLSTNTKRVVHKIPNIAAKLLSWGHPLEIMDGDAASVPESWIKAVLKEIRSIIKDKTLYIISVLGIQSSGKSTLLNTMFGLQFSVSAGRCTRGIYAQLIPVHESKSSLKFDYALVIDTEGLRAPELAGEKYNHDNELATLVIGLADVAVINIKGETIADMQDVLQIVVHALIRLKNANEELNIKHSCVFVHQNVSASNAGKSTFQGSQKVTSVLDEMTKHIAEQEKMANITRFTDVIAFNPVTNVIHVPDLWQGVPPMAPASPEYSKKVFQVAKCILGDICKNKKSFLNSEDTSLHLGNLWKGIISEDFVFSFRNALEVKAFTMLEMKFQSFVWTLQELKLQYLQNTLIQICCSETHEILQNTITNIKEQFHKNLHEKTASCDKELQSFFDESDLSDYMIHWRARKTEELQAISRNIRIEIHTKIESEKGKCEALFNSNKKLASVKENVTSKAVEFAKSENNKEHTWNEEDVKKQFERLWEEWLGELAPEVSEDAIQKKIAEMKLQVQNEIQNKFSSHQAVYTKVSNSMRLPPQKRMTKLIGCIREEDIDEKDIEVIEIKEKVKSVFGKFLPEWIKDYLQIHKHYFEKTKNMIDTIFSDIEKYMQTQNENVEYNSAQFIQVLNYITDGFRNHNDKSNVHTFTVKIRLEAKTTIMVERYAVNEFTQHIRRYEIQNSLRSKMTKYKKEVESLFLGMYFETANEELATSIICDHIENALRPRISQELHKQMWSQVTHSEFGNRKEPLIKAVLTDLAQKHQFRDYVTYINNSKSYVSSWIEKYTKTLFEKKNNNGVSEFQQCITKSLETACVTIQKCAVGAEAEGKKQSCNSESEEKTDVSPSLQQLACWDRWINDFRDRLVRENFQMPPDCFQTVLHLKVEKIDNLIKNIERNLDVRRHSLYDTFKNMPLSNMSWGDIDPFKEIMETLWGCDKNCPWCLEPCVVSSTNDRHACKQHRPEGIAGVRWTRTTKLVCESCDFSVQSDSQRRCGSWCKCDLKTDGHHPCKEYKTHMKESWDISGSSDMSSSKYWIWVFKEFEKDFVKYHNAKSPDFPNSDAFKVTKDEAINSLSVYE